MSWADNETDIEKLLKVVKEIADALTGAISIGSGGVDAAAWTSMSTLIALAQSQITEMYAEEARRRIKVNQILKNIETFLSKVSQLK